MEVDYINYKLTGFFSQTVTDYIDGAPVLRPFYGYRPDLAGFSELLKHKKVIANRGVLVSILNKQYGFESGSPEVPRFESSSRFVSNVAVQDNVKLLIKAETYTVTTGHQLNIFAGPLYFIFKICTAIKLSQQLKAAFPDKNFVPVYWMASEDHDFAEINYTNIGGKKVHWWYEASGATGRINPDSMRQALNQYKGVLGISAHAEELAGIVEAAYTKFDKLADATRYLVDSLFGRYGLVVMDADDRAFKQQFAPIMDQDITLQNSFRNITETNKDLAQQGVNIQVNPREINFFYLLDGLRERIVFEKDLYTVLNTEISFTAEELKTEINDYPERFSPNVVMRPLYQECILPNIAYIGGGAEIVYWLELKANFEYYKVDFPILILRNSGLIVSKETAKRITGMDLEAEDIFKSTDALKSYWVKKHSGHSLNIAEESEEIAAVFEKLKLRAAKIDSTLAPSAEAVEARLRHALGNLEKKLVKAEKQNYHTRLQQIEQIKEDLFPKNSLQERTENFGLFYVKWGRQLIDDLITGFEPLDFKFTVFSESH